MSSHRWIVGTAAWLLLVVAAACGGTPIKTPSAPAEPIEPAPAVSTPPAAAPAEQPAPVAAAPAPMKPAAAPAKKPSAPPPATKAEKTEPVAEAAPAPPPPPQPVVKTLPAGTEFHLEFLDAVSSQTSQVGDRFRARVAKDVAADGIVVIPAGSTVTGSVSEVHKLAKIGGQAMLTLSFESLELPSGKSLPLQSSLHLEGKKETGKDAAIIGGSAAGGALLGQLLGKDRKATAIGAVVGAAAGTAAAAGTKGQDLTFAVGTPLTLKTQAPLEITVYR